MVWAQEDRAQTSFVCSKAKKNIFLIGDSIRIGYSETVKRELADVACVFYVDDNCRNTQYVMANLNTWKEQIDDPAAIDVVHFNCGHWDIGHWYGAKENLTSLTEYAKNIAMIVEVLRGMFPNAQIVYATTNPMNPDGSQSTVLRTNAEIDRYNAAGVQAAEKMGVQVSDLNAFARAWGSEWFADYCHYTQAGFERLGKEVAARIRSML